MHNISVEIAKVSLQKMFSGKRYDICAVDGIIKMLNIIVDKNLYTHLVVLHCVDFDEMTNNVRQFAYQGTMKLLSEGDKFDFNDLDTREGKLSKDLGEKFGIN